MRNFLEGNIHSELFEVIDEVTQHRPTPLREFDQIYMLREDLALHLSIISSWTHGKHVAFVGDFDGVALSLLYAAYLGILPAPSSCAVFDFDERVLDWKCTVSDRLGFGDKLQCVLYNVFDPIPPKYRGTFDLFHTNPPYGQHNRGRSIIAFLERSMAMTKKGGKGILVLAMDERYRWTKTVLVSVFEFLCSKGVIPVRALDRLHRYHLDDQPSLESGIIFLDNIDPSKAFSPDEPLPTYYKSAFYGRHSVDIPRYIKKH